MNSDERALVDIALTAIYIPDIVSGKTKKDLFDDIGMQAALKYKIGVIGEAVKRLSKTFRDMHPSIPWKKSQVCATMSITNMTISTLILFGTL